MTPNKLLTVREVAATLVVSKMTVYRLIEREELPAFRIGKGFRIDPRDFADFMRSVDTTAGSRDGGAA